MLRLHELDIDLTVLVSARRAGVDDQLNVDAFVVHVGDTSIDVPVVRIPARLLAPHEMAGHAGSGGPRLRLTQHARHVRAPPAGTAAESKDLRRGRSGLLA